MKNREPRKAFALRGSRFITKSQLGVLFWGRNSRTFYKCLQSKIAVPVCAGHAL